MMVDAFLNCNAANFTLGMPAQFLHATACLANAWEMCAWSSARLPQKYPIENVFAHNLDVCMVTGTGAARAQMT